MALAIDEAIAVLARTPAVLRALLEGLPERLLHGDEGPGTFSPAEVLGHLIHGERTDWIPRAEIILRDGESRAFDPFDRFAHRERGRGRTVGDLLDEFEERRAANLARLREIAAADPDLEARGRHPELGSVTLGELLATWVAHDLSHLSQVGRVMARQYEELVGPWRAYMSLLRPPAPGD